MGMTRNHLACIESSTYSSNRLSRSFLCPPWGVSLWRLWLVGESGSIALDRGSDSGFPRFSHLQTWDGPGPLSSAFNLRAGSVRYSSQNVSDNQWCPRQFLFRLCLRYYTQVRCWYSLNAFHARLSAGYALAWQRNVRGSCNDFLFFWEEPRAACKACKLHFPIEIFRGWPCSKWLALRGWDANNGD